MATFLERYTLSQLGAFQARVGIAVIRVATSVISESTASTAQTRKRADLARTTLADPVAVALRWALVLAAADVPGDATDETLEGFVTDLWDPVAGVTAEDLPG